MRFSNLIGGQPARWKSQPVFSCSPPSLRPSREEIAFLLFAGAEPFAWSASCGDNRRFRPLVRPRGKWKAVKIKRTHTPRLPSSYLTVRACQRPRIMLWGRPLQSRLLVIPKSKHNDKGFRQRNSFFPDFRRWSFANDKFWSST